jgi:hypothetical protein
MATSPSSADRFKDTITILGGVGALAYAAGFIVVTLNLQIWGFWNTSLASPRYISVGLAVILFLSFSVLPAYYCLLNCLHGWSTRPAWNLASTVACLVAIVCVPVCLTLIASTQPPWSQESLTLIRLTWINLWAGRWSLLMWSICTFLLASILHVIGGNTPCSDWVNKHKPLILALSILLIFLAIRAYTVGIYPNVNPAYGGGQIIQIQFVIDEKEKRVMEDLRIPFDTDCVSMPVGFLAESEKTVFILIEDKNPEEAIPGAENKVNEDSSPNYNRAAQIDKSIVKAIFWAPAIPAKPNPVSSKDGEPDKIKPPRDKGTRQTEK